MTRGWIKNSSRIRYKAAALAPLHKTPLLSFAPSSLTFSIIARMTLILDKNQCLHLCAIPLLSVLEAGMTQGDSLPFCWPLGFHFISLLSLFPSLSPAFHPAPRSCLRAPSSPQLIFISNINTCLFLPAFFSPLGCSFAFLPDLEFKTPLLRGNNAALCSWGLYRAGSQLFHWSLSENPPRVKNELSSLQTWHYMPQHIIGKLIRHVHNESKRASTEVTANI